MANSHDAFLQLLDSGWVVTGGALTEWMATDTDDFDPSALERRRAAPAACDYDVEALRADVIADRDLLRVFADEAAPGGARGRPQARSRSSRSWPSWPRRPTMDGLTPAIAAGRPQGDHLQLLRRHRGVGRAVPRAGHRQRRAPRPVSRIAWPSSRAGRATARTSLWGFAPRTTDAPVGREEDRYDILVTTDVLAEGVNLQQARHIINYDLPWNPMRLVQRHGRIDRIGSPHDRVFLRCFFPDVQLDDLLGLELRLQRKIAQAAASVGVEGEILPGSKIGEVTFAETRDEILRLRREDPALFELGGEKGDAYSGEAFRQELRRGLEPSSPFNAAVKGLAWGSGSGLARDGAPPGFVFCARVADHESAQFRYVVYENAEEPEVSADTLTCLFQAEATPETERVLDEATHNRAYDAWALARDHIFEEWQKATDPVNLQPKVPKTMRDAAALLKKHPPTDIVQTEVDRLIEAIEAPYGTRIQKMIREAMRSSG